AVVANGEREAVPSSTRAEGERGLARLPQRLSHVGRFDPVGDRVTSELHTWFHQRLDETSIDGLIGTGCAHGERTNPTPGPPVRGCGQASEHSADGRLPHRGEDLLRGYRVVLQRLVAHLEPLGDRIELVSHLRKRLRGALDPSQRRGRGSPWTRRTDQTQRLN